MGSYSEHPSQFTLLRKKEKSGPTKIYFQNICIFLFLYINAAKELQEDVILLKQSLEARGFMITASSLRVSNEDYSIFSISYNTFIIQLPDTEYNLMAGYFIF